MRWIPALALIAASAASAQDFYDIAKGYDRALVSRITREHRHPPPAAAPLADRPILSRFAFDDDPELMRLANSLPTAACHPKASRAKHSPRNLGITAADTSAKIGAACYQRF